MATLKEQGFYGKGAWKRARLQALTRDHWLCQECLRHRRFRNAVEVHHIKPLEQFPELGLELDNLESLCRECHEATKDRTEHRKNPPPRLILKGGQHTYEGIRVIKI